MEYITVYEIEKNFFPYFILIPLVLLVLFGTLYYYLLKFQIKNILNIFLPIGIIFMLFLSIANIYGFIDTKTNIVEPYFNDEYFTVEGSVTNFKPLALHENGTESFVVNGVKFNYSKAAIEYVGYNKVFDEGGYIKKNGQNVRIRYIHDKTYDINVILKLEVLKTENQALESKKRQGTVLCLVY